MSRSISLIKTTTRSDSQRKTRKSGSQRKTRKSARESKKLKKKKSTRRSTKSAEKMNEITKFNAELNIANLFMDKGEQVTSFLKKYKDVNSQFKKVLDMAADSQGKSMSDDYIIDGVISIGKIKKSISSTFMLFNKHIDYSRMFTRSIFDMVSIIMFYEIPNDVELELVEYKKIKLRKKKFGFIGTSEYVEIGRQKIEKDKIYVVPDYHYYSIISKEEYKKSRTIKYIWLCVQVGQSHKRR